MKPNLLAPLLAAMTIHCATAAPAPSDAPVCSVESIRETSAPRVTPDMNVVGAWTGALTEGEADRVLLTADEIATLNARNRAANLAAHQDVLDEAVGNPTRIQGELQERLDWLDDKLAKEAYVEARAGSYAEARGRIEASTSRDTVHVAAAEADIRCVPMDEGLFTPPADEAFDRNRCSRLHLGEVVRVLRQADGGDWLYVHAGHSVGWLHAPVLTPVVEGPRTDPFRGVGTYAVVTDDLKLGDRMLRMGRRFPLAGRAGGGWQITLPTAEGFETVELGADAPLHAGPMALTRANVWRLGLARLDEPYGWGGYRGGRDCSRLLLDLFSVFGLDLGRHSRAQAHAGSTFIDLRGMEESAKITALTEAAGRGVVLAYMPGHSMLHLGERDGRLYTLSAMSEYVRPCNTGRSTSGDQVVRLDRAAVTDYEVGRDTGRMAFIQRLTALSVFGAP